MKTAYSWLKAYVPGLDVTPEEFRDGMTLSGTKVEGVTRLDKNLEKIVVGKIMQIDRHPDADKLIVCQVDVGGALQAGGGAHGHLLQIVTGAPNVKVGDCVPVVLAGGKVAGGHDGGPLPEGGIPIKAGKLRGVESFGMMCSIEELGSDRNYYPDAPEDGIYILPNDSKPGDDAVALLGLRDCVFEFEVTSNRVDCYSVIGIAREAAATFGKEFCPPVAGGHGVGGGGGGGGAQSVGAVMPAKAASHSTGANPAQAIHDLLKVRVDDTKLCPRYVARMATNIRLAPSPEWLQRRLAACGIRPINNIVDITNYVMEEYGQPMHAFDYDQLAGREIIVRTAKDGDTFQTLDGQVRNLDATMLMICDGEKEVGIAGIMGGENSKITDSVRTMVFEAACFDGTNIRLSAKKLGMRTDASGKFEKGLDPNNALEACNRACDLIALLDAGDVVEGAIDIYPHPVGEKTIPFHPDKINRLLGTDIEAGFMLDVFRSLGLKYIPDGKTPVGETSGEETAGGKTPGGKTTGSGDFAGAAGGATVASGGASKGDPGRGNADTNADANADTNADANADANASGGHVGAALGTVCIPTFRQDLECEADLAEEVARFYGYDKIPATLPSGAATTGGLSWKLRVEQLARRIAEHAGFSQSMTYSFESEKVFDRLRLPADAREREAVTIINPLGEDFKVMRTLPLGGMLTSLSTNYNRRNKDVRLYELANIYLPGSLPLTELPDERMQLTFGMYGAGDFYTLKGVIETLLRALGIPGRPAYDAQAGKPFLHPGRQAAVWLDVGSAGRAIDAGTTPQVAGSGDGAAAAGSKGMGGAAAGHGDPAKGAAAVGRICIGYLGEVHPETLDQYKIGDRAYVAVVDMPLLTQLATFDRIYRGLARYPSVNRDISMVAPKGTPVGDIEAVIARRGGRILESCELFDIYEGGQIPAGYKSVAYSIKFRASDRTLEDKEVQGVMEKILHGLREIGIELRG
ncbi:MAG: phenylalanine--tRNA ligase subunit beta [Lachnospiraceae bacterium]|jgi:phenylalanyl-tRNA synthetase beta subunit|nr:phenylalanine--tRNA ligase subunit beta [Lachnospiraceae bacterium]